MDEDRQATATPPASADLAAPAGARRFWFEHAGRMIDLRPGNVTLGRSSSCHIVLDDALVSRQHARVVIGDDDVTVHDLGSVNGIFVNGRRIVGTQRLKDSDQLQLGTQVLVLRSLIESTRARLGQRFGQETLRKLEITPPTDGRMSSALTETEATFSAHTLDLLGGVAEKVLALGRGDEAEKMLTMTLNNLLSEVRTRRGSSTPQVAEKAVHYALKLAEVTGKGRWLDYALELYAELKRPLAPQLVDQLYSVLRHVDAVNLTNLRAYVASLREMQQSFGPSERFVLQRLEGFERLAALK